MTAQQRLKWAHLAAAVGWFIAGVVGYAVGWTASIPFLFWASVWANVASHLTGVSGERPDQEVLDRLDHLGECIDRIEERLG